MNQAEQLIAVLRKIIDSKEECIRLQKKQIALLEELVKQKDVSILLAKKGLLV